MRMQVAQAEVRGYLARKGQVRVWRASDVVDGGAKERDDMTAMETATGATRKRRPRPKRFLYLDDDMFLEAEAKRRDMPPIELANLLLAYVCSDRLFDAVLDGDT